MKEKPILLQGPMVLRVLDDTKTQTRRVVRGQPESLWQEYCSTGDRLVPWAFKFSDGTVRSVKNPHGRPGDKLWVKETWKPTRSPILEKKSFVRYRADDTRREIAHDVKCGGQDKERWRPSIFMFRWASRIDLEVLEVRVQRLQDISEADAVAEGVDPGCGNCGENSLPNGCGCSDPEPLPVDSFIYLWNSINRKPKPVLVKKKVVSYISYPWEDIRETREHRGLPWRVHGNPAVFANTFRRVRP